MISQSMTAPEVIQLYGSMKDYYAAAWAKMERAEALYNHRFPHLEDTVPEGVDIHEPSTAASIIDHFRDNIRVHNIVPSREDWGITKKAREQKALLLRLDGQVLRRLRERSAVDLFVQTIFDMALRGAACSRVRYDPHAWPEVPEGMGGAKRADFMQERSMNWPLPAEPVDPLDVMPAPGGAWPIPWLIHRRMATTWEVKAEYPGWSNPRRRKPNAQVERVELWSGDAHDDTAGWVPGVHKVLVDGEFVVNRVNPYGVVPYVYEYSGMGRIDSSNDPSTLAVNMLEKAESELQSEARIKTAGDAVWQFTAFPRLLVTDDPANLKLRWDLSSGGILQVHGLGPDQKPQWLEQPQVDASMWSFLSVVQASIEKATFSSVLTGQRQPGVDYGYLQALLVGQASLRKDNIIGMASRMFGRLVGLTERLAVKLEIEPIGLGPGSSGERPRLVYASDIGDRYDVQVTIEASDPAERDRRMISWATPLRARAISKRTYLREGLMMADPDEELAAIYEETVIEQIMASGLLTQQVLASLQADNRAEVLEDAAGRQFRDLERAVEGRMATGLAPRAAQSEQPYGTPTTEQSPVSPSPLAVVQSVNRQATGLSRS